jgi:hypothetical protein
MASIRTTNIGDILIIKKIAQYNKILTNHSDHPECVYPKATDVNRILTVGSNLTVIAKGKRETKWAESYVTVKDRNNNSFDILSSDLRRFCK